MLNHLFEDSIKDLHNAEKQLLKTLPKMEKNATHPKLKEAIRNHIGQTEEHVRRLEEVAKICGFKPTGMVCKGMQGLIEEATEHLGKLKPGEGMDAEIIASAQKAEHYEMCGYGTARAWAQQMGKQDCAQLLERTLKEEEQTDQLLNQIAEGEVNRMAAKQPEQDGAKNSAGAAKSKTTTMKKKVSVR